jgi:protein-S-isoprenylcysteine O-methyltransferase Ste14
MTSTRQREVRSWNHIRAIALLPFMNVVVIPALIVAASGEFAVSRIAGTELTTVLANVSAALLLLAGVALVARCIELFIRRGHGTLAPWDPTQRLIIEGPYRYLRNPLKAGLFLVLIGECLLLRSTWLALWTASFIVVNVIYIRVSEEPGLRARFGQTYGDYCAVVPRWQPRLAPARCTPANRGDLA